MNLLTQAAQERPLRAVFFDLDDTLCASAPAWMAGETAAFTLLQERWPQVARDDALAEWRAVNERLFQRLDAGELTMARVRERRFRALLRRLGQEDDALADELNALLARTRLANLRLYDDAVATLDALRPHFHLGIVTNGAGDAHDDSQWSTMQQLRLPDLVDSFWISDEVGFRKPDPRIFEGALEEVGVDPTQAVHVGDSPSKDVAGANAAGMTSVLIWRGEGEPPCDSPAERPRLTIHQLAELPRWLSSRR